MSKSKLVIKSHNSPLLHKNFDGALGWIYLGQSGFLPLPVLKKTGIRPLVLVIFCNISICKLWGAWDLQNYWEGANVGRGMGVGDNRKKGGRGAKIKRQGWGLQNYRGWGLYPPILPHCDVLNSWNILQFKLLKQYSERSFGVLFCSCSSRLPRNITNVNKPVKESYSAQTCQGKLLCPAS